MFYSRVEFTSQKNRSISEKTLYWWSQQSEAARNEVFNPAGKISLRVALYELSEFIKYGKIISDEDGLPGTIPPELSIDEVWSYGANFDIAILSELYLKYGQEIPWSYKNTMCLRTLVSLTKVERPKFDKDAIQHHALQDCINQAVWCQRCMQVLGKNKGLKEE
jgi:hypothetical protein